MKDKKQRHITAVFIGLMMVASVLGVIPIVVAVEPGAADVTQEVTEATTLADPTSTVSHTHDTYFYTVGDVIFFGYKDNTVLELFDSAGIKKWGGTLNKGQHAFVKVSEGVYHAKGSEKFAILVGDPISRYVCGYFAMDNEGFGASTELYTWVPRYGWAGEKFIIFAYQNSTAVTLKDSTTGAVIWSGTLNKGEHHEVTGLESKWLQVISDKPVSALAYYDQGYFTPSANGKFSGTEFYTYVGKVGGWTQDLTVMAYNDGTSVTIKDSDTGTLIWTGTLNSGQAHVESFRNLEKYITVTGSDTVSVSVQPWKSSTSSYHQGAYVPDRTGSGIGTDFIATSLTGGLLDVFAYEDNTTVNVYDSQTGALVNSYTLNEGDYVNANPGNGLWRIKSDKIVSVWSGWGKWSADFAPLRFGKAAQPKLCPDKYRWGSYNWDPFPDTFVGRQEVHFMNNGPGDAYNVTATVTCTPINVVATDPTVTLGDIPAGGSAWSTDTFELRVDMTNPQDPNKGICYRVEYDDAAGVHHTIEDVAKYCGEECSAICP